MSVIMIRPLNCARIKKIKIKLHPSLSRDGATESVDWKNPGRGARRWKSIWLLSASLPFSASSIKQKMDPFCMPTRISWKFTVGKSKRVKPKLRSVLHWTNLADFYLSGLELNKIEKRGHKSYNVHGQWSSHRRPLQLRIAVIVCHCAVRPVCFHHFWYSGSRAANWIFGFLNQFGNDHPSK